MCPPLAAVLNMMAAVWKDEHSQGIVRSDPAYNDFESLFFNTVSPFEAVWENVPVRGNNPLPEVL